MPRPRLQWKSYRVKTLPNRGLDVLRPFRKANTAAPFEGVEPQAVPPLAEAAEIEIDLPDLSAFPSAMDKARYLLAVAAEIEHALMVQYLYAAYSVRKRDDFTDPQQKAAVRKWKGACRETAVEEMGHFLSVQNLLMAIGLPPNLEREDSPFLGDVYPFPLHLEPLNRVSLAKYVFAESPPEAPAGTEAAFGEIQQLLAMNQTTVNKVGLLYTLIGVLFSDTVDLSTIDTSGNNGGRKFYLDAVRDLRAKVVKAGHEQEWLLGAPVFGNGIGRQAESADWPMTTPSGEEGVGVFVVKDGRSAMEALADIAIQGEGPGGPAVGESHFARFFDAFAGTPPFPTSADAFNPTLEMVTDPILPGSASQGHLMDHPLAMKWAAAADASYALILYFIQHYMLSDSQNRAIWSESAVENEMMGHLREALGELVKLPATAAGTGVGSLPFTLPPVINLSLDEVVRKDQLRRAVQDAADKATAVRDSYDPASSQFQTADGWLSTYSQYITDLNS